MTHSEYMARALALAERGRGRTSPNPLVGAVIVDPEGVIVGRGSHEYAGGPHAEIVALREAGPRAKGATLYCTLEPCSHTGRTGPCAPVIADAGLARVVVADVDPNPLVNGRGIELLRGRGIEVTTGVLAGEARALNRPFRMMITQGRPLVTMKVALSADRRVAAVPGRRTQLTGAAANRVIHRDRAEVDAIAVGSGTVLADDPVLTARGAYRRRPLTRIVFDTRLRTPPSARLFSTLAAGPVIIVSTRAAIEASPERAERLRQVGADVLGCEEPRLASALQQFGTRGMSSLIVEGGVALHRAFWDAGLVDRVQIYVTSTSLGAQGVAWLEWPLPRLRAVTTRTLGTDTLTEAYVHRPD